MLGQLWVVLEPDDVPPEPVPPDDEVPDPELPVLLLDEDGVVVEELVVVLVVEPELPVDEVVAALATSAPPATRPEVSAPTASIFRKRSFMVWLPFVCGPAPARSRGTTERAPPTCGQPHSHVGPLVELPCEPMTILR
jgi:hypothetical protein